MAAKIKAQEVAIGSKGNGSVATGPKAKQGKDKVQAHLATVKSLALDYVKLDTDLEAISGSKIECLMSAAEVLHNDPVDLKVYREGLKEGYEAAGKATQTIRAYVTDAVRILGACYLTVHVDKKKDGSVVYKKVGKGQRGTSGKAVLSGMSYNEARQVSSAIMRAYGKKGKAGRKPQAVKPLDAGQVIDLIDKAMGAVRMLAGVPDSKAVIEALQTAKRIIKGVPKAAGASKTNLKLVTAVESKRPTLGVLTRKDGKPVVHGSKEWNAMSRGQKAAATRRFHEHQATRVVPSNQAMH